MQVDVIHKRDDDIIILLHFTFTLPNKSLKTGTKPCICAFTLPPQKANTFNNIEIKWLHFALHYRPRALATQKVYKQASAVIYKLPLNSYRLSSWMGMPRVRLPNAGQPRETLLDKHGASNIPDDNRHSVGNTERQREA